MKPLKLHDDSGVTIKNRQDLSRALIGLRQLNNIEQSDMKMLIGMSQQQYQSIEAGANATISTLLRVLEGLGAELVIVPAKTHHYPHQSDWFEGVKNFFSQPAQSQATAFNKIARDVAHLRDDD